MRFHHTLSRRLLTLGLAAATVLVVAACGGGDGNNPTVSMNTGNGGGNTEVGGGNGSSGGNGSNQVTISVNSGLANVVNMPTVSLTICAPGSSTVCQVIPNVLVDTASYGVRIVASAASGVTNSLPTSNASGGGQLAECGKFVSSYTWGSVRTANVQIGGQVASSLPIQLIGDLGTSNVPSSCTNNGRLSSANTAQALGANGILGIGPAPYDCGVNCATSTAYSNYYACTSGSCRVTTASLAQQVANPVPNFPSNNNGVIVSMGMPSGGAASGTLTFGIGSTPATVLHTDTAGDMTGTFNGAAMSQVFFDTGSNAYFFGMTSNPTLPLCNGNNAFYCPSSTTTLPATVTGLGSNEQASLSVIAANATTLFNSGGYALAKLAGPFGNASTLDFGMPYFYGRTLYFGMDLTANGGPAPYVGF